MALDKGTLEQLTTAVRRFTEEQLIPNERLVEENDQIPEAILTAMRDLGLFGLSIPEEYGGLGLDLAEECAVIFELCRASPAYRSAIGTNVNIGSQGIIIDGTEAQKRAYLPRLASGDLIGAFALTEPDSGSDAASISTSAKRDGDDYILNGTKRYITNAPEAGLFTVFARTSPDVPGADGISGFLIEAGTPGLSVGALDRKMGQRGAHSADVILENCRVGRDTLIGGQEGIGFKTAMRILDRSRIHIGAVCVGVAERLIDQSTRYALERKQFGQPIADFQLIQAMLADSRTEAYAARCMVETTARRRDNGERVAADASCCKLFCTEMVGRVADRAVQIHGGAGYISDYGVERMYRDVRLFRLYEGTSQIQQVIIARDMIRQMSAALS